MCAHARQTELKIKLHFGKSVYTAKRLLSLIQLVLKQQTINYVNESGNCLTSFE